MGSTESQRELERRILGEVPRLRAFLRNLAGEEADDLVQETIARGLRYRSAFRPAGSLVGWMTRIAFRVFLDHRARAARAPEALGEREREIAAPETMGLDDREEIDRRLAVLSDMEREILLAFHRDGRSIAEIAQRRRMPAGTVKSHLHRARRKLGRRGPTQRDAGGTEAG